MTNKEIQIIRIKWLKSALDVTKDKIEAASIRAAIISLELKTGTRNDK
jgi:hypothetical protein